MFRGFIRLMVMGYLTLAVPTLTAHLLLGRWSLEIVAWLFITILALLFFVVDCIAVANCLHALRLVRGRLSFWNEYFGAGLDYQECEPELRALEERQTELWRRARTFRDKEFNRQLYALLAEEEGLNKAFGLLLTRERERQPSS